MFKLAKSSAIKARTQTINQLKAVLVAADPQLRESLADLSNLRLIRRCAQLEIHTPLRHHQRRRLYPATAGPAHPDAYRRDPRAGTPDHHRRHQPQSPTAVLIAAGDNPDRLRSEASFAALWRQPAGSLLRQNQSSPPQPRR